MIRYPQVKIDSIAKYKQQTKLTSLDGDTLGPIEGWDVGPDEGWRDGVCEGLLEGELETGLPFGALVGVSEDGWDDGCWLGWDEGCVLKVGESDGCNRDRKRREEFVRWRQKKMTRDTWYEHFWLMIKTDDSYHQTRNTTTCRIARWLWWWLFTCAWLFACTWLDRSIDQ